MTSGSISLNSLVQGWATVLVWGPYLAK